MGLEVDFLGNFLKKMIFVRLLKKLTVHFYFKNWENEFSNKGT